MLLGYNEALFFVDAGGIGPYDLTMIGPALSLKQLGYVQHPTNYHVFHCLTRIFLCIASGLDLLVVRWS